MVFLTGGWGIGCTMTVTIVFFRRFLDEGALLEKENCWCADSENVTPVTMPVIPNAPVVKVAVTGDFPPLDLVLPDGTPAGFNTAFLAELANRVKVNFELVPMDSGARPLAIAKGHVDALFCFQDTFGVDDKPLGISLNNTENLVYSKPFFRDRRAAVKLAD